MSGSPAKKAKLSTDGHAKWQKIPAILEDLSAGREKFENSSKYLFNEKRIKVLKDNPGFLKQECKNVAYWMSRYRRNMYYLI